MSVDLLDKTRKINGLLRDNRVSKVAFTDLCQVLGDLLDSKVFVISSKGKVLGMSPGAEEGILSGFPSAKGKLIDAKLSKRFLEVLSTKENVNLETLGIPREETGELQAYGIEDIILTEYSTTVVGLEMMRSVAEEADYANRKQQVVESVMHILSPLETKAAEFVLCHLDSGEGTIVTSRLAKEVGITRTVIVNALKKLESAGVLETKSYGVKGTHIKILNDIVFAEFENSANKKAEM